MIDSTKPIRVRMAPSPTGGLHIGTARATLFNYLFAKRYKGAFVLRIEDTDTERSKERYTKELIEGLDWLGISWDEGPNDDLSDKGEFGPYHQSQRGKIYKQYLEQLLEEKKIYWCYCTKEELDADKEKQKEEGNKAPIYRGPCRTLDTEPAGKTERVLRLAMPEKEGTFSDLIRGEVQYNSRLMGDIVVAKSLDYILYNLANVIDDHLMEISHVIRGEDHLSNTPKQVMMYEMLGFDLPVFAHLPLILGDDKKKLSKRKNETSLLNYRDAGYLPEAMVNFMALLGWHASGDQEFFTHEELIEAFSIERVQKSGARFMIDKLKFLNKEHLKAMDTKINVERLMPFLEKAGVSATKEQAAAFLAAQAYRGDTLKEIAGEALWLGRGVEPTKEMLTAKDGEQNAEQQLLVLFEMLTGSISLDVFEKELAEYAEAEGKRQVYWPLRIALSGLERSPDPMTILRVLGKEEGLRRIEIAQLRNRE